MSGLATARTFLSNFSVPCLYVALAAGLLVIGPTACVTKKLSDGRALRAEKELANFRAEVAGQTATVVRSALEQQQAAWDDEQTRQKAIETALREGDAALANKMEVFRNDITKQLRTSLSAPEWACLRQPLPPDVSGLYQRKGGYATLSD